MQRTTDGYAGWISWIFEDAYQHVGIKTLRTNISISEVGRFFGIIFSLYQFQARQLLFLLFNLCLEI